MSYKTLFGSKPLCIRFDEVERFVRVYDGIRYLVLFDSEQYNAIYNRIRYLLSQKVVLYMFFLIIMRKYKLILMIPYL